MSKTVWLKVEKTNLALLLEKNKSLDFSIKQQWDFDAGLDVKACILNPIEIKPSEKVVIGTGLRLELSNPNYEVQVRSRSGLAAKNGVMVLNSPGTIDYMYREEVGVILANLGKDPFIVNPGDRIAQLCVREMPKVVVQYGTIERTARGGFGSTGKN